MLPRTPQAQSESGFTLVELLVVILIIGVLTAVAVPAFMNQREKANNASLETDLRNVAMAYETWRVNSDNTNMKWRSITGNNGLSVFVSTDSSTISNNGPNRTHWHEVPELPSAKVSDANLIEFLVMARSTSAWDTAHEEGEFCAIGTNSSSSYDFVSDAGMGRGAFDRVLYYDKKLGGIKTMAELSAAMDAGKEASCYWYAREWKNATGN